MQLIELARVYCSVHALAPKTMKNYCECAVFFCNPDIENMTESWLRNYRDRARSATTWNARLDQLRAMMRFAIGQGWVSENTSEHPVFLVNRRAVSNQSIIRTITLDEYKTILKLVGDEVSPRYQPGWFWTALLETAYYTGLRRQHLIALKWRDIDLGAQTFLIRATSDKLQKESLLPLHPHLTEVLVKYRGLLDTVVPFNAARQVFHLHAARGDLDGFPTTAEQLTKLFVDISAAIGKRVTCHMFRHTFATELARRVKDVHTVQMLLNHSKLETTLRYVHPTAADLLALMDMPLTAPKRRT